MRRQRFGIAVAVLLVAPALDALGADRSTDVKGLTAASKADATPATTAEVRALVEQIDQLIAARWEATKTQPAAPADDAEFLRRVSLDITGKIPTAIETRAFLDDPAPDKREKLIEKLLASPGYMNHQTNIWKDLLLPEEKANFQVQFFALNFDPWLRRKFAENVGYDKIVREIVTAKVTQGTNQGFNPFNQSTPSPYAFFAAKEGKPENLAAGTSRLFLGIRLECAQCHDHPFARWKRDQFWGYAAFFAGIDRQGDPDAFFQAREFSDRRELNVPGTERVVQASFLDGSEPQWKSKVGPRVTLADW
ncbi:MAG TPA: DUF1549 domain-containing protein, partial [Isosphaeraceae bacterium]|nr:DUF1549 domain-containing protein [Isosphaeraceae bacterium]